MSIRILLIDGRFLREPLLQLGCDVVQLPVEPGVVDLAAALDRQDAPPDLVLQVEFLGPRRILQGLERCPCPTLFWSLDTHLNLFWTADYARGFDVVCTTQKHCLRALREANPHAHWLTWWGAEADFVPHGERERDLGFVGRLTQERPARTWMAEHLAARFGLDVQQSLTVSEMLAYYARTRIAPNEAIAEELNLRIFEAGQQGCAVVTPRVEGVEELFPDGEVALYDHVLQLEAHIERLLTDPARAEAMGLALAKRIAAEHTLEARARSILDIVREGARRRKTDDHFWLTLWRLSRAGRMDVNTRLLGSALAERSGRPGMLAPLVILRAEQDAEGLHDLLVHILRNDVRGDIRLDAACSMAALRLGKLGMARRFLERAAPERRPADADALLFEWAELLLGSGVVADTGFVFDPDRHLPATASDCAALLQKRLGESESVAELWERVAEQLKGAAAMQLGAQSFLSLRRRRDWRLTMRLGLTNLRVFRREAGLEELRQARALALEQGQGDDFLRELGAMDGDGTIRQALGRPTPETARRGA